MRGFAITLDAIVALSLLLFALLILSTQTFEPKAPRGTYLKQLTLDSLTVLGKSGRLSLALGGDTAPAREILQATPDAACIQVSMIDDSGETVATISKTDCYGYGSELQSASMPFVHDGEAYMANAQAWYRKARE